MASKKSRSRPTTRPESTLPPLPSEVARAEEPEAEEETGAIDSGDDPPEDELVYQVLEDIETPATDEELREIRLEVLEDVVDQVLEHLGTPATDEELGETRLEGMLRQIKALLPEEDLVEQTLEDLEAAAEEEELEEARLEGMLRLASALMPEDEDEDWPEDEQEREGEFDAPANTGQERASAREELAPPSEASVLPRSVRAAGYTVDQFVLPWGKNCKRGTCPKRSGTMAEAAWRLYGSGRRISDYLADRSMDKRKLREALAWDIERGLVTVADSLEG